MSEQHRRRADAELVEQCRAGDRQALERLVRLFVPVLYAEVARGWRLHGPVRVEEIKDGVQNLFRDLLEGPEALLGSFNPRRMALKTFLARLGRWRAETLCREELCRHRHEALASADRPADHRRAETGVEERAARLTPRLTRQQRIVLQAVLERTLSEVAETLSPANLRQVVHRIGQKRREQDAEEALRAGDGAA
jgi:hypothetical protein